MGEELRKRLCDDIEQGFPREGGWCILALENSAAPIVTISRDPRTGDLVVPVFFVAIQDQAKIIPFASLLYECTHHLAKLWHTKPGKSLPQYLIIPALYHEVEASAFASTLRTVLGEYDGQQDFAWVCENCEVLIRAGDREYKAIRGSDGGLLVLSPGN